MYRASPRGYTFIPVPDNRSCITFPTRSVPYSCSTVPHQEVPPSFLYLTIDLVSHFVQGASHIAVVQSLTKRFIPSFLYLAIDLVSHFLQAVVRCLTVHSYIPKNRSCITFPTRSIPYSCSTEPHLEVIPSFLYLTINPVSHFLQGASHIAVVQSLT